MHIHFYSLNQSKLVVLLLITFLTVSLSANAQIKLMMAQDKEKGALDYEIMYNNNYNEVNAAFASKGYHNSFWWNQPVNIEYTQGYLVVVEYKSKKDNGVLCRHMGIGASATSYQEAEQNAAKNLGTYYWSWVKSMGYTVVEKRTFDLKEARECVIAKLIFKKDIAGNRKLMKVTYITGKLTDEEYRKLRNENNRTTESGAYEFVLTRILASSGKVGVLKNTITENNVTIDKVILVNAPTGAKYNVELYPEGTITTGDEDPKYVLFDETTIQGKSFSPIDYIKGKLRQSGQEEMKKTNPKTKSASLGVRG